MRQWPPPRCHGATAVTSSGLAALTLPCWLCACSVHMLTCRELCVLALALWFLRCSCGVHPLAGLGVVLLVLQVWCWIQAANRKEYVAGHRAGAKGYTGGTAWHVRLFFKTAGARRVIQQQPQPQFRSPPA
jgi:hypothetical protein